MASYRLETFGSLSLWECQRSASIIVGKSKLSVLAVIAASGPTGISRDRLASLFWSESDSERSRNSLNQALFALRRVTPAATVIDGSDILKLNDAGCAVDFIEFESLVAAGNNEEAIAAYRGAFLDGVRLNYSSELERWVEQKRTAIDALYEKALRQLFAQAAAVCDFDTMLDTARRRAVLLPYDASAAECLVRTLCESGNTELARRHVAIYERLVTQDIGGAPDAKVAAVLKKCDVPHDDLPFDARRVPAPVAQLPNDGSESPVIALGSDHRPEIRSSSNGRLRIMYGAVLILLIVASIGIALKNFHRKESVGKAKGETIAVFPFCVSGAGTGADLSNGMVDLIVASLPSDAGPRPLDAHATISAANKAGNPCQVSKAVLRTVATRLGAAGFISGDVIIASGNVILSARLGRSAAGEPGGRSVQSRGSAADLHEVVGKLSSRIQAVLINEPERRLPDILARSTSALSAYLRGRALWRSGQKGLAINEYVTALDADSTFALAGLALAEAGGWTWGGEYETARRGVIRASATAERLSERDKALLDALIGNPPRRRSDLQVLLDWARAIDRGPDSPTAWYEYGDRLYHTGAGIGHRNSVADAKSAFDNAVGLDSSYTIPLGHLIEIAIDAGDTVAVRKYQKLYELAGPDAEYRDFVEWRVVEFFRDQKKLADLKAGLGKFSLGSLQRVAGISQLENVDLDFGMLALQELKRKSVIPMLQFDVSVRIHDRAVNDQNWPLAENAILQFNSNGPIPGYLIDVVSADALRMTDILFGGADTIHVNQLLSRLEVSAANKPASEDGVPKYLGENCVLGIWYAPRDAVKSKVFLKRIEAIRQGAESADRFPGNPALCSAMIDAEDMVAHHPENARPAINRLDSLSTIGIQTFGKVFSNLETARLFASIGDRDNALRAVRRRRYEWTEAVRYLTASRTFEKTLLSRNFTRAGRKSKATE